ncbi:MAG: hypothetical protein QOE90_273 [Thermoplasmata archaeon]|jgi:hypothetical protein|nr:hypothetical protein [Thermoplasmata archaeon]
MIRTTLLSLALVGAALGFVAGAAQATPPVCGDPNVVQGVQDCPAYALGLAHDELHLVGHILCLATTFEPPIIQPIGCDL